MKKYLTLTLLVSLVCISYAHAAPSFSQPILSKAYDQVSIRIDQKASKIILDENAQKALEQRKAELGDILVSIDQAFQARDKARFKEQVKLFRESYKEAIQFAADPTSVSSRAIVHKNIPKALRGTGAIETTGKSTDITYYADSFEGGKTANGNPFSQSYFSAAACEIPLNSLAQVTKDGVSVIVKINDRPNCTKYPNLTDLSATAFRTLGKLSSGKLPGTINPLGTVPKNYIKKTIDTTTFKDLGITLDSDIPNTYLKNETLHITGKELLGKDYTILYLKSPGGKDTTLGMKKGVDGSFEYNYPLEEVGTYQMIVASGLGFKTTTFLEITVLDESIFLAKKLVNSTKKAEQLSSLDVERVELPDFTPIYVVHFPTKDLHTLTIKGDTETFTYKGFGNIALRGSALKSLNSDKPVVVEVTLAESSTVFSHDTTTKPISIFKKTMALVPGYKTEKNENITATEESGNLVIHGMVQKGKNVKSEIVLTLPSGDVTKYRFDSSYIDSDGFMKREKAFETNIPLKQTGLYLVEVNYDNGFAAFNGPITYGEIFAAYPNELDDTQKQVGADDATSVANESLKFINQIRAKSGKSALTLDDTLNNLATIKAQDMADHNNLSHTDSNGDKISGTAKRNNLKITGAIGENIAGGNIGYKVLLIGLANSGGHRANMLDAWKHMGVGYAVKDGQVYYAQVFGD